MKLSHWIRHCLVFHSR